MTMLMKAAPEPVEAQFFDRSYWLEHCVGFRVDTAEGRLGFVEDIRPEEELLVVRAGLLGRRRVFVSTSDVDFVVPRAERIWLLSEAAVLDTAPTRGVADLGESR